MGTIPSFQKGDPSMKLASSEEIQESIYPNYHEVNITDGCEFLDDAIRMKDQPLAETKQRIMNDTMQKTSIYR